MENKISSIIIIIAIILIIVGIWFLKNDKSNQELEEIKNEAMEITSDFNIEKLKESKLPIIIDFGSEDCMPCKQMEPDLKQVYEETKGKAIVRFIDVWEYPQLADGYPVELIPIQIFINSDGTPYAPENAEDIQLEFITDDNGNHTLTRHIGALTVDDMKSMLREMGLNE